MDEFGDVYFGLTGRDRMVNYTSCTSYWSFLLYYEKVKEYVSSFLARLGQCEWKIQAHLPQ